MDNQHRLDIQNYQTPNESDGVLDLSSRHEPSPSGSKDSTSQNIDLHKFNNHYLAPQTSNFIPHGNQPGPNCPHISSYLGNYHVPNYVMNAVAYQQQIAHSQLAAQEQQESPALSPASTSSSVEACSAEGSNYPLITGRDGKLVRPFKAYPRDPLSVSAGITTSEAIDAQSAKDYHVFRKRMMNDILQSNGGTPTISNPKMRRTSKKSPTSTATAQQNVGDAESDTNDAASMDNEGTTRDAAYYERRQKNNAAAKKSRDRRRLKEDEIAIRIAFLERENLELKIKLTEALHKWEMFETL